MQVAGAITLVISMIMWIQTSSLSIKNPFSLHINTELSLCRWLTRLHARRQKEAKEASSPELVAVLSRERESQWGGGEGLSERKREREKERERQRERKRE
jgi:hypothetical protein